MTGNPADVGRAPIDIGFGMDVEYVFVRKCSTQKISRRGVHDAFGLGGRAAGVKQIKQILGGISFGRGIYAQIRIRHPVPKTDV